MGLFSISGEEENYFNGNSDFIELVSCPTRQEFCTEHLQFINEKMGLSNNYRVNKDFSQAIEALKIAFYKTTEIQSPSCVQCVELFRSTIIKSLEAIQEDIRSMTSGFFRAKRYKSDFEFATKVLDELKKGPTNFESV